ncbi:hypothetical protein NVP1170O_076 [Vibrio phage 1.170.O._10N.261.52.C3]|nr:hypothetical protein NVP1170O_076 [Vibrio phage 1.170.O._10N.261.52.C3]
MRKSKRSVGEVFESNRCGKFIITKVLGSSCEVKFFDTGWVSIFKNKHIVEGKVKDQKARLTFGVGYTDGQKTMINKKYLPSYSYWLGILERGYSEKLVLKYPSYERVSVCDEWHSYKNFNKWFEDNYREEFNGYGLDKDLICRGLDKIYSPKTCVFLPQRLNTLLINKYKNRKGKTLPIGVTKKSGDSKYCARYHIGEKQPYVIGYFDCAEEAWRSYKTYKEEYIKSLAEEYYSKGKISTKVYCLLMSYEVFKEYQ